MTSIDFDPELIAALQVAKNITVLTGAGVSAESGIPTFRDALTGLWLNFDAERLATAEAFQCDPGLVWGWYEWRRMKALVAKPNAAHIAIAQLSHLVPQLHLFTQNVDDLHERAGSHDVQHLHGCLHQPRCFDCGSPFPLPEVLPAEPEGGRRVMPPRCPDCGGFIRPGVVWFNELLPNKTLQQAFDLSSSCDLLIVVGTSGEVYPVAQLPEMAARTGAKVIQINPARSKLDGVCTWNLRASAAKLLPALISCAF